jgi:hypothetical protein
MKMKKVFGAGMLLIALVLSTGVTAFAQVLGGYQTIQRAVGIYAAAGVKAANCRGEQLSLREAEGEADMGGKRYGNYIFTNTSSTPCTLAGYPKFVLLNKSGKPLPGVKVTYDDAFVNRSADENKSAGKPQPITLGPGKTAWFQIFYNDGMALDRKKPFPVAAKVRVTAPKTTRAFVLDSQIQACCGVQVSSIRNGSPQ